jgi:hypothetical protein
MSNIPNAKTAPTPYSNSGPGPLEVPDDEENDIDNMDSIRRLQQNIF